MNSCYFGRGTKWLISSIILSSFCPLSSPDPPPHLLTPSPHYPLSPPPPPPPPPPPIHRLSQVLVVSLRSVTSHSADQVTILTTGTSMTSPPAPPLPHRPSPHPCPPPRLRHPRLRVGVVISNRVISSKPNNDKKKKVLVVPVVSVLGPKGVYRYSKVRLWST